MKKVFSFFLAMTLTYQVSVEKGLQLGNLESIGLHIIALHLTGSLIFA